MSAILIQDLKKTYSNGLEALKGISLEVKSGEFFGLLGPNGAGKSTTIGIISSLVRKNSGDVIINGQNLDTASSLVRKDLGIVPQEFNFNIFETCYQIVINQAGYYGVPRDIAKKRADDLFNELGLWDKRDVQSGKLSGGLKRRLMIARALVHQPNILILDEPTAGVDISLRRSMWRFLKSQNRANLTIIMTTHYLEEAEQLCERIAIIDKGTIIENDKTTHLLEKLNSETFVLLCDQVPSNFKIPDIEVRTIDSNSMEVDLAKNQSISDLMSYLAGQGLKVNRLKNKANRLEELFINLVEG